MVNLFATLRTINILCRSITHGSFTRKTSPVIYILVITGLAKVSSADLDRTIDGREELFKSFHLIDHTLNLDLVYICTTSHEKNCSFAFILMIVSTQYEIVHPLNDSLYGKNICVIKWSCIISSACFFLFIIFFFQLLSAIQSIDEVLNPSPTEDESFPRSRRGTPRRWGDTAPWRRASKRMPQQLQKSEGWLFYHLVTHMIANSGVQLARPRTVQSYKLLA